jgi:lipoprotein-releasing system permease protein
MFVGWSVAFGIVSVLVVSVIQRSKDIGILRAMEPLKGKFCVCSCLQSGLLGCAGSLAGSGGRHGRGARKSWANNSRRAGMKQSRCPASNSSLHVDMSNPLAGT